MIKSVTVSGQPFTDFRNLLVDVYLNTPCEDGYSTYGDITLEQGNVIKNFHFLYALNGAVVGVAEYEAADVVELYTILMIPLNQIRYIDLAEDYAQVEFETEEAVD